MYLPYVGITDFMTLSQVEDMQVVFKTNLRPGSKRKLHVGVMTSYKILHEMATKWSKAFPLKEEIASIFGSPQAYNCLHYVDYEDHNCVWKDLSQAISYGGANINALQLDMIWPDPWDIRDGVKTSGKKVEVILQVGMKAIEEADNDPDVVIQWLKRYNGFIDRVLLDMSMGRGVSMNTEVLMPFAKAISRKLPELGLVVAGGLGPNTIGLVEPLVQKFPDISIDAQGKLRPSGSALDPIDWGFAEKYLVEALKILK